MNIIGTPLFQWETGRQLQITPLQNMTVSVVHFSNPGDLGALVVKPKEVDGKIVADIPNILLQKGSNIVAYSVNVSSDCVETLRDCIFPVRKRPKPSDYVYTETEILNYSSLSKRIDDMEGEGLAKAVEAYLAENPVEAGATKEEAAQIAQNKDDIANLKKDKLNASELPTAINDALAQAKASGEFDGNDYILTDADKTEIAEMAAELVEVPDYGGNVELDTTLTQSGKAADAKAVGDKIAEITGISLIEPAYDDIPKIFFGGALQQTKDEAVVPFRYISKTDDFSGYAEIKAQGNSSMSYPKKNQTVKMFKDADCTEKMKVDFKGWGKQNKHVYKANWIDLTHARNVVSARLWGDVVKSRANYAKLPELLRTSPNQGAVDGFPVKVYAAGVYQGRYTLNIPKDAWMANMDKDLDTHCILCGENYVSGCFRAAANINESDWTDEIHDTVPASIKTRWNQVISFVMNSTDDEFRANLNQYFYVDSLIDYYLFGLASCGLDAFGKNQLYMTYDGQKWIATMYDMDSTWGLWWNGSSFVATDYDRSEYQDFKDGEGNLLYIRLENLFYEELKARWAELRSGALSIENIINRFERFTDIAPAELVKEDYASTTGDGKFTGIPSKSASTIQQIRGYAVARHAWCDTYVAALSGGGEVDPDEPEIPDESVPCTDIALDNTELVFDGEGTQTITATVTPSDTTDSVVWVSSAPAVASITVDGNVCTVRGVGNGNAEIVVTCGEQSATCAVSVSGIVVEPVTWTSEPAYKIDETTGELVSGDHYVSSLISMEDGHYQFNRSTDYDWRGAAGYADDGTFVKHYGESQVDITFDVVGPIKQVRLSVHPTATNVDFAAIENNVVKSGIWSNGGYKINSTTGEIEFSNSSADKVTAERVLVEPGATYRIANINSGNAIWIGFAEYDANGTFIKMNDGSATSNAFEKTVESNTAYIVAKASTRSDPNSTIEITKVG